jgi:hypothetical protein
MAVNHAVIGSIPIPTVFCHFCASLRDGRLHPAPGIQKMSDEPLDSTSRASKRSYPSASFMRADQTSA